MDRPFGTLRFWTTSPVAGSDSTALQLHREMREQTAVVAEVVYSDGVGQYFLETFGGDVPLDVLEEFIAEAKDLIRYK